MHLVKLIFAVAKLALHSFFDCIWFVTLLRADDNGDFLGWDLCFWPILPCSSSHAKQYYFPLIRFLQVFFSLSFNIRSIWTPMEHRCEQMLFFDSYRHFRLCSLFISSSCKILVPMFACSRPVFSNNSDGSGSSIYVSYFPVPWPDFVTRQQRITLLSRQIKEYVPFAVLISAQSRNKWLLEWTRKAQPVSLWRNWKLIHLCTS